MLTLISTSTGLVGIIVAILAILSRNKNVRETNKLTGEMDFRRSIDKRFSSMENRFSEIRQDMRSDKKELREAIDKGREAMDKGFESLREDIRRIQK